ncbi:MAG: hypothetical protein K9K75_02000 [Deltaproteobacteria bacterium]|nr:hypothetical protein [Deltaproteobacteria bacterium]
MKNKNSLILFVLLFLLLDVGCAYAQEGMIPAKIHILADKLIGNYNDQEVEFIDNVVCKQGERVFVGDSLKVFYRNSTLNSSKELDRIEAYHNARVFHGTKVLSGDKLVFYAEEQRVVATGEPTIWDGKNYVRGSRIIFYLETGEGIVEGNSTKRVSAEIYPSGNSSGVGR